MPTLDTLATEAVASGLALRGAFHPEAQDEVPGFPDGAPAQTLVLFGFVGRAQGPVFAASPEYADGRADPLDRWSQRVIGELGARHDAIGWYPSMGPPWRPFQRWGMRAEAVHPSPLGLLIHPDYGLWHAYRGALGFRDRLALPAVDPRTSPCETCAGRPCLSACPVGALRAGAYERSICAAHVASEAGRDCLALSCRARRSCPVGEAYRYGGAQSAFHMSAFLAHPQPDRAPSGRLSRWTPVLVVIGFLCSLRALPQTDEIQVYTGEIAAPGVFNLTLHDNYTPDGRTTATFPGGIVPNHTLNGVPEWSYGVTPWFEEGLYLPLYSLTGNGRLDYDGLKVRTLFVLPDSANQTFFYGVNFEFSRNAAHWDPSRYTQEIRPIIGWHLGPVDLIVNPILDNSWKGFSRLDFAPESRAAYNFSKTWALALEEYDDLGPLRGFLPESQQQHQLFGVFDFSGKPWSIEGGVGVGLTSASDRLVMKLILSRDLN